MESEIFRCLICREEKEYVYNEGGVVIKEYYCNCKTIQTTKPLDAALKRIQNDRSKPVPKNQSSPQKS